MITTKWNVYKVLTHAWDELVKLYKIESGFDSQEEAIEWLEENSNDHEKLTYFSEYTILPVYKMEER